MKGSYRKFCFSAIKNRAAAIAGRGDQLGLVPTEATPTNYRSMFLLLGAML
jgi:hypothetical protein